MRLLLDQNLSHRIVAAVADLFPGSSHVRDHNLQHSDDSSVWEFAARNGYSIVSKDEDFHQRSFLEGAPPKVIWLQTGNCDTGRIVQLLRDRFEDILAFDADPTASFLVLS